MHRVQVAWPTAAKALNVLSNKSQKGANGKTDNLLNLKRPAQKKLLQRSDHLGTSLGPCKLEQAQQTRDSKLQTQMQKTPTQDAELWYNSVQINDQCSW